VSGGKITAVSEKQTAGRHYRINYSRVVIAVNVLFIRRRYVTHILGGQVCAVRQDILTPPVGTPGIYCVRIIS